jgi:hypothetical protein
MARRSPLAQPAGLTELLGKLAATSSRPVVVATAGLVGLRDGAIPAACERELELAEACLDLARSPTVLPAHMRSHRRLTWRPSKEPSSSATVRGAHACRDR